VVEVVEFPTLGTVRGGSGSVATTQQAQFVQRDSLEMVQSYTRSVTFEDSLKLYKAPLG
jgi:hypothetical protein